MKGLTLSEVVAGEQLSSLIERIERLEEEKAGLMADIKEVYDEAKTHGFDAKILRQVIRLRKMEKSDRQEQETILSLYLEAVGEAPLGG